MRIALGLSMLAGCLTLSAGSICPAASGTNPFPHPPDPTGTGCNAVITIAANGSVSVAVTDPTPYENGEDVVVGIKNNSPTPVSSISLKGGTGGMIFALDGDGLCIYTFVGSSYCSASQTSGTDPQDYYGPTSTFTNINSTTLNSGTVNFNPPIAANGGSTYFSLEGVPSASLTATVTGTGSSVSTAPTLGEWGMILLGTLLIGCAAVLMGRKANQTV